MRLNVRGPAGPLEAIIDEPRPASGQPPPVPRAAVVFAHPHPQQGGTMHTKVVYQGAKGLARIGCAVLRFNFRGVGASGGAWDEGQGEREDFRAAITEMEERYPGAPIWAAGFSFGSWVALEEGSIDPRVSLLIGIAPPVTREGYHFEAIYESEKPKFLIQGAMDEICPVRDLWTFYARLKEPKDVIIIDRANHLFDGQAAEVGEALESLLGDLE